MSKEEDSVSVVEIKEEYEERWGDEPNQTDKKLLIDTDEYDEDFPNVIKDMEWNISHYSAEYDDDENWKGWSIDKDALPDVKTHLYNNGYAVVDERDK